MSGHRIDTSRGECRGDLSRQWASRPDDQKFLDLGALHAQTRSWAEQSRSIEAIPVDFDVDVIDGDLAIGLGGDMLEATHYGMGQLARMAGVPANYLRDPRVPADLAAACLLNGLATADQDTKVAAYVRTNGTSTLRAVTSPSYGRIFDHEVAESVMRIAGNGIGDTRWKVPGCIDWRTSSYDADRPITKESTTLYASDRDLFLFLCDDRNPVEVGLLRDGSPDLMFRGLIVSNSEVGERAFGVTTMWLRGVCWNRNLWGVEGWQEMMIRHTSGGPARFAQDVAPALEQYAEGGVETVAKQVQAAKALAFNDTDADAQVNFLASKMGFSRKQAMAIVGTDPDGADEHEADRFPGNVWELSQAATAWTRTIPFQDQRVDAEQRIGRTMDRILT